MHSARKTPIAGPLSLLGAIIAVAVVLVIAGCSSNTTTSSSSNASDSGTTAMSDLELVHTDDPLADFAANSAASILPGNMAPARPTDSSVVPVNTCYSPISLYLALALCADGTQGNACDQILSLLGAEDNTALLEFCKETIDSLEDTYDPYTLKIADSIWANSGYSFKEGYLSRVRDSLKAEAFDVEFGTEAANEQIAQWISDRTEGLLNPQFDTSPSMIAALINTIYFKDSWTNAFSESATAPATFHTGTTDTEVPFMNISLDRTFYAEEENYTAAQLDFQGGGYMTFYLPNEGITPLELIETPHMARELLDTPFATRKVNWSVPKFTIDSSFKELVDNLEAMGITDIFDPNNEDMFAPMLERNGSDVESAYIGEVIQETHLALDENGVEAAAYTAMMIKALAMEPDDTEDPIEFTLDRPFLYTITSPDNVVLFVGCVWLPA